MPLSPRFAHAARLVVAGLLLTLAPSLRAAPAPALVVVIAIDQFRADYLVRFREYFGPDGFNLFLEQGANFTDCHYQHSITKTAPGHALILSGVHANVHGIIANDWLDRATLKRINSVDDDSVQPVGLAVEPTGVRLPGSNPRIGGSPRNFLATTVGDEFKLARAGRPKVIAISSKDRAAVLLGGKLADAAYWLDKGRVITSTYYMKELPPWARAFNDSGRVESYFGKVWDRLLPVAAYEARQGPDDMPGESPEFSMPRTFPKKIDGGADKITPAFFDSFENSPFKSEVLEEFGKTVVENENLGRRGVTDIFCMSFSANDTVGHAYGPDSHEVMDMTVRTDRLLADFFKFLEARVGLKNCLIVLSADHGIAPLPEVVKSTRPQIDAGRVDLPRILNVCEAALNKAFGPLGEGRRWLANDATWMLFNQGVLKEKNLAATAAENVVRDAMLTVDFVQTAFTRSQLEAGDAPGDFGRAALLSFNRARSGDVLFQPKPYWVERKTGTNHGTPYNYDNHVPLLWYGVGVKPGTYVQRIGVDDLAPTLSHLLGIPAPPMSRGIVLF